MKNEFFVQKMKTSLNKIICHSKSYNVVEYGIIWKNYAITLVIWLESRESSYMIALFWIGFFKIFAIFKVSYFS
jgi:hypothetical protein